MGLRVLPADVLGRAKLMQPSTRATIEKLRAELEAQLEKRAREIGMEPKATGEAWEDNNRERDAEPRKGYGQIVQARATDPMGVPVQAIQTRIAELGAIIGNLAHELEDARERAAQANMHLKRTEQQYAEVAGQLANLMADHQAGPKSAMSAQGHM